MSFNTSEKSLTTIKMHAEQHEVIQTETFKTAEEYVLHLMHLSDYERAALLTTDLNVLDLGCNGGYGTSILAKRCKEIIGVDVSQTAIEYAIKKYNSSNIEFKVVDGIILPFQDQYFDMVTSFQVIEHLVDLQSYLNEIRRVLKPGGLLVITTPNAAIRLLPGQKPWNPFHVREFRYDELFPILQRHFMYLNVVGQFAKFHTYAIEYNRCISARGLLLNEMSIHRRALRKIWHLTTSIYHIITKMSNPLDADQPLSKISGRHSICDFNYKSSNHDKSLSLVALCSDDRARVELALNAFTSDY